MNTRNHIHQKNIMDSSGLLPNTNWKAGLLHIAILVTFVFLTQISAARADMVFDFQMKLAKKGNAEAQYKVGEMYEAGRGVDVNKDEAMKWFTQAADGGSQNAKDKLLYVDMEKNGLTKDNKAEYEGLKTRAKGGNEYAQYYLGMMYSHGVGVKKNYNKADDLLGKASLAGVTAAETELVKVREVNQSAQLRAQREAERKRMAAEDTKRKEEERKKIEARKKADEADRRKRDAQAAVQKQKAAEQKARAEREAAAKREAEKQRLLAQREAEAAERERQKQALLAERQEKEQKKQEKFESDPCSGKSARFLSTCR
jgi:flagellar biosynthesis GTPase FlhF